jgi:acetolactate synthase-1/2/3 large subunit
MTSAGHVIGYLKSSGVEWMATLCGHGLNPLFYAARDAGLRLIDTRNEQTAAYLADYWGKLTGKPAICAVSSGVAHANALTGVANAWFDRSPMLLVSGAGALATAGLGHFQDMDQVGMAKPVTKYARTIDAPGRAVEIFAEALAESAAAPRGPAHITYPLDMQTARVGRGLTPPTVSPVDSPGVIPDSVERALAKARRPLILAGSGVFYEQAGAELLDFTARHGIPFQIPIWDRGFVSDPHPAYCGVIGAASGGPDLLAQSDCVILAGTGVDYRVGYASPAKKFLRVDRGLSGWSSISAPGYGDWLATARKALAAHRAGVEAIGRKQARKGQHAMHIVDAIRAVRTPDTMLLVDGGSIGQWAHQLLFPEIYPGHCLTCGRSGVVGWGLGGAMAARLARPASPVILLSGDGSFTFTVAELECAVRQKLPFVAIVADDQAWGITRTGHEKEFGKAVSSSLGPIAFDRLAESLGARGRVARTPEAIRQELREALELDAVTVLHVPIVGGLCVR